MCCWRAASAKRQTNPKNEKVTKNPVPKSDSEFIEIHHVRHGLIHVGGESRIVQQGPGHTSGQWSALPSPADLPTSRSLQ